MSLTNMNTNFRRKSFKIEFIKLSNVEGAVVSPNGIAKNSNYLHVFLEFVWECILASL